MTARNRNAAFLRWLCPLLVIVVILGMSPGAALAATKPGIPEDLTATPGNKQVVLTWTAPASGSSDITDYRVQYRKAGALSWKVFPDGLSPDTGATVTFLVNGTNYQFRVGARNEAGQGKWSSPVSAAPVASGPTKPGAPTGLTATAGDKQVILNWTAPSGSPGITDYRVQYRKAGAMSWVTFPDGGGTATTATVKPLANGTAYQFRVRAKTSAGLGAPSNVASATPGSSDPTVPEKPSNLTATGGNKQVALDWDAPYNGGSAITDYRVQYRKAGAMTWVTFPDGVSTATAATVTFLVNGTAYQFRVMALNDVGLSDPSDPASATPNEATAAGAPLNLTATPGNQQVALDWDAPSDGGSAITDYVVQYRIGSASWTTFPDGGGIATAATVTGLTNGTLYQFRVQTINGEGGGPWATTSATPANPATVPGIPGSLDVVGEHEHSIDLDWNAPSDGGSPITDYEAQYCEAYWWWGSWSCYSGWTFFEGGTSTNPNMTVTGLDDHNTDYLFQVRAVNAVGAGSWSGSVHGETDW